MRRRTFACGDSRIGPDSARCETDYIAGAAVRTGRLPVAKDRSFLSDPLRITNRQAQLARLESSKLSSGHTTDRQIRVKRATKAALLSGLIFPGIGHMILKRYLRGSFLVLAGLIATYIVVADVLRRAQIIVDQINSGDIPVDSGALTAMVSNSTDEAHSLAVTVSLTVLFVCWLIGIIDSYRIGIAQEK